MGALKDIFEGAEKAVILGPAKVVGGNLGRGAHLGFWGLVAHHFDMAEACDAAQPFQALADRGVETMKAGKQQFLSGLQALTR